MRKNNLLIICGITAILLAGCTKSNIVTGGPAEPVFETQEGIVLDWGEIGDDLDEQFINSGEYPVAVSIGYSVNPDEKTLELNLMVLEGTTPEAAVEYANEVVRMVGEEAATQDFSYAGSGDDSYGGVFDEYTLNLTVLPDGTQTSESNWLVNMTIPAGSHEKIVPLEGAKAMETTVASEEEEEVDPEAEEETDEADTAE